MPTSDRMVLDLVEAAWPAAPEGFARAMFGAYGLKTASGGSFGIVSDGCLFLKRSEPTTDDSIPWIEYEREGRIIRMRYALVDPDILEDPMRLGVLLRQARAVADAEVRPKRSGSVRRGKRGPAD